MICNSDVLTLPAKKATRISNFKDSRGNILTLMLCRDLLRQEAPEKKHANTEDTGESA